MSDPSQDRVTVTLLLFAKARELLAASSVTLAVPASVTRVPDLVSHIVSVHPVLKRLGGTFVLAHNETYLDHESEVVLRPGDELAVIPPISGG